MPRAKTKKAEIERRKKISDALKGCHPKSEWKKGSHVSPKTEFKKGHIPWSKEKTGEKHPRWKGGSDFYWQQKSKEAWEKYHGRKIPPGGLIHHKDGDRTNISKKNLELIITKSGQLKDSIGKHISWHGTLRILRKRTKEFLKKEKIK